MKLRGSKLEETLEVGEKRTHGNVRTRGNDGQGMSGGVIEGGGAEMRSQSQTPFGRRNESVNHINDFTLVFDDVLKICLLVLCFEPPLGFIPDYLWRVGSRSCYRVWSRHGCPFEILGCSTSEIATLFGIRGFLFWNWNLGLCLN